MFQTFLVTGSRVRGIECGWIMVNDTHITHVHNCLCSRYLAPYTHKSSRHEEYAHLTSLHTTSLDITSLDVTSLDMTSLDMTSLDITSLDITSLTSLESRIVGATSQRVKL